MNAKEHDIIKKLQALRRVVPPEDLSDRVVGEWVPLLLTTVQYYPIFRLALAAFLLLFIGSSLAVASFYSQPGHPLYPIKVAGMRFIRAGVSVQTPQEAPTPTPSPTLIPTPTSTPIRVSSPTPTPTPLAAEILLPSITPPPLPSPTLPVEVRIKTDLPISLEIPAIIVATPAVQIQIQTPILGIRLGL